MVALTRKHDKRHVAFKKFGARNLLTDVAEIPYQESIHFKDKKKKSGNTKGKLAIKLSRNVLSTQKMILTPHVWLPLSKLTHIH